MSTTPSTAGARSRRRWLALGVIAATQFMVIMDTSIIGVALPKMQHDLGFTSQGLSWVFNAYVVAFGGLLLLGGRLSDLFGARRIFSLGWVVLAAGSLIAGFAGNVPVELAGRALQGAGSALIAPAALTLLFMTFGSSPKELTKALALYGAAAPAGGTAGVFLGGVLTEYASWPWVFFINMRTAASTSPVLIAPDRLTGLGERPPWAQRLDADQPAFPPPQLRLLTARRKVRDPPQRPVLDPTADHPARRTRTLPADRFDDDLDLPRREPADAEHVELVLDPEQHCRSLRHTRGLAAGRCERPTACRGREPLRLRHPAQVRRASNGGRRSSATSTPTVRATAAPKPSTD